jgi:acetyl-CoA carboxylase biotin carboxyl carrier protein
LPSYGKFIDTGDKMDIRKVKKLIDLVKETGIAELEIEEDKERVRITSTMQTAASQQFIAAQPLQAAAGSQHIPAKSGEIAAQSPQIADDASKHSIKSPMVGTVFLSASPGAKAFVSVGQQVKVGDVVCLIEAMKMFNRIEADKNGIVKAILVQNEQPVEFGQPLIIIEE